MNPNILRYSSGGVRAYTDLGCYPLFYLTKDCGVLCPKCVQDHLELCEGDPAEIFNEQWEVIAHDVNWKDPDLFCDHCNERIESAYAEKE